MRTYDRLEALRKWTYETVCRGKLMKTPAKDANVMHVSRQEPQAFVAWFPTRKDEHGYDANSPLNTVPSVLIMPTESYSKYVEVFRKNTEWKIHRPEEMGHGLNCQVLFAVFEDGVRLPGFVETAGKYDMSLIKEGTQDGLRTLLDWMDEFQEALLAAKVLPGTDMMVMEATMTYGLHRDGQYVSDKRPIYYGIVEVGFNCHADEAAPNQEIASLLD